MRHFVIVVLVGITTLTIVFALYRPDLLEGAWLWVVGLIGPIVAVMRAGYKRITSFFRSLTANLNNLRKP